MHILVDAINDNAHVRGPDRYLLELLGALSRIDLENRYTICCAPWQTALRAVPLADNFSRVCLKPPRQRAFRVLWHALWFPRLSARLKPDIVFLPNLIFAPLLGRPSVMTVHDLAHFRYPEKFGVFRGYLQRALIHAAFRLSDRVISVSRFTTDDIARFIGYPGSRIRQIAEGAPKPRSLEHRSQTSRYFLYVGQLERSKNIEALIAAFCRSDKLARAGVELRIAGYPGNATDRIQRALRENGAERVKLLGYVDEDALAHLYGNCTAFIFPSLIEGFGLVLLEAMAHGAPVVAMRTSAIPEVVGDAGILLDPSDPDALRRTMEDLASNPELCANLRERGYERVKQFSWTEAARQSLEVLREVAG